MMKAVVIYSSKTGITKCLAENISAFLESKNVTVLSIASIDDYNVSHVEEADMVLLGCWTSGLFLFLQHPNQQWVKFAKQLPSVVNKKIVLFTTYKVSIGGFFQKMKNVLNITSSNNVLTIKSKSSDFSTDNQEQLLKLL